jgi:hypothetical protein
MALQELMQCLSSSCIKVGRDWKSSLRLNVRIDENNLIKLRIVFILSLKITKNAAHALRLRDNDKSVKTVLDDNKFSQ